MEVCVVTLLLASVSMLAQTAPITNPTGPVESMIANNLKEFQTKLSSLNDEFKNILNTVNKKPVDKSEKRQITYTSSKAYEKVYKNKNKLRKFPSEPDPFIAKLAMTVANKLSINDSAAVIEGVVNATTNHLVKTMNASQGGVDEFQNKLTAAVLQILNKRALENKPPANKSSSVTPTRVLQALGEILKGPLISGFVSKEEEKLMIRSAITALSKELGMSKVALEDVVRAMIAYASKDAEKSAGKSTKTKAMSDEEKIMGLEKMIEEKMKEKNLTVDETKHLVKGLAVAVGARNKLSDEKTKQLEDKIWKGVEEFMKKNKKPEDNGSDTSILNDKEIPEGFREAQEAKNKRESEGDDSSGNLFDQLRKLEGKWHKTKYDRGSDAAKKRAAKMAEAQKQKLKEEFEKSSAEMDKLDAEQMTSKPMHAQTARPTTSKPMHARLTHAQIAQPTQGQEPQPTQGNQDYATKENKIPMEKKDIISGDLEKEIEKAAFEIQKELEAQEKKQKLENEKKEAGRAEHDKQKAEQEKQTKEQIAKETKELEEQMEKEKVQDKKQKNKHDEQEEKEKLENAKQIWEVGKELEKELEKVGEVKETTKKKIEKEKQEETEAQKTKLEEKLEEQKAKQNLKDKLEKAMEKSDKIKEKDEKKKAKEKTEKQSEDQKAKLEKELEEQKAKQDLKNELEKAMEKVDEIKKKLNNETEEGKVKDAIEQGQEKVEDGKEKVKEVKENAASKHAKEKISEDLSGKPESTIEKELENLGKETSFLVELQ